MDNVQILIFLVFLLIIVVYSYVLIISKPKKEPYKTEIKLEQLNFRGDFLEVGELHPVFIEHQGMFKIGENGEITLIHRKKLKEPKKQDLQKKVA